jgi:hypothetical protein
MSGYLSRIVRTAASSRERLHPLTGSIYGEPAKSARAFSTQLNDTPFSIDSEAPVSSTSERAAVGNPSLHPLEEFLHNYQPLQPHASQPNQESRTNFEPRLAPMHDRPQTAELAPAPRELRLREITPAGTQEGETITARMVEPTGDQNATRQRRRQNSDIDALKSILRADHSDMVNAESLNRRAEQSSSKDSTPFFASDHAPLVAPQALIPAQSPQKQRTPESRTQQPSIREQRSQSKQESSIEIHIGRIEVLAVQPPAPSAPAPRRDRTTSLADYLARQNGRHA